MLRRLTSFILCFYFLAGSLIFPLGDFSLMKDLPKMYKAYTQLASADEQGIADFVGDYLLGGKSLLGHNKNDAPESSRSNVQFQHAANFCSIVTNAIQFQHITFRDFPKVLFGHSPIFATTEFHNELFRPPLTTIA